MRTKSRKHDISIILLAKAIFGGKIITWRVILVFFALLLAAEWLPEGVIQLLDFAIPNKLMPWVKPIFGSILFLGVILFMKKAAKQYFPPLNVEKETPPPKKVLAIFLSTLSKEQDDVKSKLINLPIHSSETVADFHEKIKEAFKNMALGNVSWEMPLLAINHHYPKLEHLYVITSPKSDVLYSNFESAVKRMFPNLQNIHPIRAIDFEDVRVTFDAIEGIFRSGKHDTKNILVDITSGQKPSSVAAAISTLARDRKFQYVGTNDKAVSVYDVEFKKDD